MHMKAYNSLGFSIAGIMQFLKVIRGTQTLSWLSEEAQKIPRAAPIESTSTLAPAAGMLSRNVLPHPYPFWKNLQHSPHTTSVDKEVAWQT